MSLNRIIIIVFAFLVANVCAQAPTPAIKKTDAFFRTLGLSVDLQDLFYMHEKKDVPIRVTQDARSEFYPLPNRPMVEFYRIEKAPDGTNQRIPVAQAALPTGAKLLLFVFSTDPAKTPLVETLDDSLTAFPGGSYRILNRLDQPLEAIIKEQKKAIPARSVALMDARGPGRTRFVQVFVAGKPNPRLILSNNWAFYDSVRTLVVVAPSDNPIGTPLVARITEPIYLAEPQAPATQTPNSAASNP